MIEIQYSASNEKLSMPVCDPQGQCGCVLKGCSWTEHVTYIDVWSE